MIEEEKKPKVLSTDDLLSRFNAQKPGQPGSVNKELDPWGTELVDIDEMLGAQETPEVPSSDWVNANREELDKEWDDKNIFQKVGAGWHKGAEQLKGGLQNFAAEATPVIGRIGENLSGGAYTEDDIIDAMTPMRQKATQRLDEAGSIQGKGLVFETAQFMPQMVGTFAAMAAAPFTGGSSAAAIPSMLGVANIGALSSSVVGSTLYEIDKYAEEKGKEIPETTRWSVALLAGAAEFLAEKVRLDRFMPKGMASKILSRTMKESPKVAENILQQWAKSRPNLFNKLLQLGRTTLQNAGEEGAEEFFTQIAQDYANYIYQEYDDRLGFGEILGNALNAAKGGAMMGGFIGPMSYASSRVTTQMMRKRKGGISLVRTEYGKVYEAIGKGANGDIYVQDPNGRQSIINSSDIDGRIDLSNAEMKEYLDAYDHSSSALPEIEARMSRDPETQIRQEGMKYVWHGGNITAPETNIVKFALLKDGRKVVLTNINNDSEEEPKDLDDFVLTAYDANDPAGKPFMVKGSDVMESKDVPFEEWVANEVRQYQATTAQIGKQVATAQSPYQPGQTIEYQGKKWGVADVNSDGSLTVDEITKEGLGASAQITPEEFNNIIGNQPQAQTGEVVGETGTKNPEIAPSDNQAVTGPPQAEQQAKPQARKISDGKNELSITPKEDGNFIVDQVFNTQRSVETTQKKLQELYPKVKFEVVVQDSGDPFTPDEYRIHAIVQKKQAPAAKVVPKPEQKQAEPSAPVMTPPASEIKPVTQGTTTPEAPAEESQVRSPEHLARVLSKLNNEKKILEEISTYGDTFGDALVAIVEKQQEILAAGLERLKSNANERGVKPIDIQEEADTYPEYIESKRLDGIIRYINDSNGTETLGRSVLEAIADVNKEIEIAPTKKIRQVKAELPTRLEVPRAEAPAEKEKGLNPKEFKAGEYVRSVYDGKIYEVVEPDKKGMAKLRNEAGDIEDWNAHNNAHFVKYNKTDVDVIAASDQVDTRPTEAEKKAGNFKKGHVKVQGLSITIENPVGTVRSGTDKDGEKWSNLMNNTYGYFKRSKAKDGEQVDVFLGDNLDSQMVFVVDQVDPGTGKFDEHKVMLGFKTQDEAKADYLANYGPDWKGLGNITPMSITQFKEWLGDATRTKKPAAEVDFTAGAKKIGNRKGFNLSPEEKAMLDSEPKTFEEAVLQFLYDRGRISMEDYYTHFGRNNSERLRNLWMYAKAENGGIKLDKLNELYVFQQHPNLLKGMDGAMDQPNAFAEILRSLGTAKDYKKNIKRRLLELQNVKPEEPELSPEEQEALDLPENVDNAAPELAEIPELMAIFEHELKELGRSFADIKATAENDPAYFQQFPYGLTNDQFNELKTILSDESRQRAIQAVVDKAGGYEGSSERDNTDRGAEPTETGGPEQGPEESGTAEGRDTGEPTEFERERAAIEKWLPGSQYNDYISFDWDGESLDIFTGRDDRIIGLSRQELIDEGVFNQEAPAEEVKPEPAPEEAPKPPTPVNIQFFPNSVLKGKSVTIETVNAETGAKEKVTTDALALQRDLRKRDALLKKLKDCVG